MLEIQINLREWSLGSGHYEEPITPGLKLNFLYPVLIELFKNNFTVRKYKKMNNPVLIHFKQAAIYIYSLVVLQETLQREFCEYSSNQRLLIFINLVHNYKWEIKHSYVPPALALLVLPYLLAATCSFFLFHDFRASPHKEVHLIPIACILTDICLKYVYVWF